LKKVSVKTKKSKKTVEKSSFIGTPEILVEKLVRAKELGVKMFIFQPQPTKKNEERKHLLEYFKDEVLSHL
jgi:hypothetical protein